MEQKDIDRFWSYVDVRGEDDCWMWIGSLMKRGGKQGRLKVKGKQLLVTRISWELHFGPIPHDDSYHGICVFHTCNEPLCCNPKHLFLGKWNERIDTEKSFWDKVRPSENSDCMEWTGYLNKAGYGLIRVDDVVMLAHRYSYELHNGPIPEGMFVCHKCDNPRCINPDHLFLGTHQDNMDDMTNKGRSVGLKGDLNGNSVLSESQALDIINNPQKSVKFYMELFNVSYHCISAVKSGETWKHLDRSKVD